MQEIKCLNCGMMFQVDESGYSQIVSQARDVEFKKELERREKDLAEKKDDDLQIVRLHKEQEQQSVLAKKDAELAEKERVIADLQHRISGNETENMLAVTEAVQQKEKELSQRKTEITELKYQQELQTVRSRQIDILRFEENMNTFKTGFAKNHELASRRFTEAVEEIDKSILRLQKLKEALTSSDNQHRLANSKADGLSIKRLAKNAPAVRATFDGLAAEGERK